VIVDTDVLIWYMRGNLKAQRAIDKLDAFSISAVTYMEILQGLRNKSELRSLRKFMTTRHIGFIPLDVDITVEHQFI